MSHTFERRQRWLIAAAIVVTAGSLIAFAAVNAGFIDLLVYRTGVFARVHGIALYSDRFAELVPGDRLPYTYPPFSIVLFTPLYLLPLPVAKVVLTACGALALLGTLLVVAVRQYGRTTTAVLAATGVAVAALAIEPVRQTISLGQINLLLMALVVLDTLLPRTRWPRGLLIGFAAAIKLLPAIFVLYFLLRRQYRAAAVACASFVACTAAGFAAAPSDSVTYWFGTIGDPDRIGGSAYSFNQCFRAVVARLMYGSPAEFPLWVLLAAGSLALAALAARRALAAGDEVTALLAIATGGLLASPVSWTHHWVWVAPAALVLVRYGWRTRVWLAVAAPVFVLGPHSWLHPNGVLWTSWWEHLVGSGYVLLGLAFLVWIAVSFRSADASRAGSPDHRPGRRQAAPGRGPTRARDVR